MILSLALSAAMLGSSPTHAQSNSEYNFRQQVEVDNSSYGPGDPVPILTVDCLAANGYGQWTLSSQSNRSNDHAGWYLMANGLYTPSLAGQYVYDLFLGGSGQNIGDINNNYWGPEIYPADAAHLPGNYTYTCSTPCFWAYSRTGTINAHNISYIADNTKQLSSPATYSGVSCGGGTGYVAKPAARIGPAVADSLPASDCQHLYGLGFNYFQGSQWRQCYDSLKLFIESCPTYAGNWRAFVWMLNAAGGLWHSDTTSYYRYQQWLKSVLFLNRTDPEYFCACLEAIAGTYQYWSDSTVEQYWREENRGLAIGQWMLLHTNCDTGLLRSRYNDTRRSQYTDWLNDTTKTLDTTLPSMHDLGLDSLLNLYLGLGGVRSPYAASLSSFRLTQNPFSTSTSLRFTLDRLTFIRTEVYDELGRMVEGDGSGHTYDSGPHELPVDLKGLPTGAYYLRISLGGGEVRTIKLIKRD